MEQAVAARTDVGRGRWQLLALIGLFLLPPVGAWFAWNYLSSHGVSETTNNGVLIQPARPVALGRLDFDPSGGADLLKGRWVMVMFTGSECGRDCREWLYLSRQVRLSVNKDMPRVRRLLVVQGGDPAGLARALSEDHPDLLVAGVPPGGIDLLHAFDGPDFGRSGVELFLVDPLGNLMMYHRLGKDRGVTGKRLLRDLQKLLKVSQVG